MNYGDIIQCFIENVWNYKNTENKSYGYITISTLRNNNFRHNFFNTNDYEGILTFSNVHRDTHNIYSSIGCFSTQNEKNKAQDVVAIPGFAIDVDIAGPGHKEKKLPPTIKDALDVLLYEMPIQPTMLVNSGGGLYPYYLFNDVLIIENNDQREHLKNISSGLQAYLRSYFEKSGWKLDNTSNLNRIYRLPGTLNLKTEEQRLAIIEYINNDVRYDMSSFEQFVVGKAKQIKEIAVNINNSNVMLAAVDKVIEKCAWLQHCRDTAATLTEPEWYAFITILCRCENGTEIIHNWSKNYPGYSLEETNRKISHALNSSKPTTCEYIHNDLQCRVCESCSSFGCIKSPISNGYANNNTDADAFISDMNEKFALIKMDGKLCIVDIQANSGHRREKLRLYTPRDFRTLNENNVIKIAGEDGKVKEINGAVFWLKSKNRHEYEDIVFCPNNDDETVFNLWQGFAVEPKENASCELYLKHIYDVIADKDEKIYEYIVSWLADLVQHPERKPGTSLVLKGNKGTGKGTFVKYLQIIFGKHFLQMTNPSHLVGKFNYQLRDKILVFADELFFAGDKASEGILKSLITEDTLLCEPKGLNAYSVKNYMRIIMASNNDWVIPAGIKERRYVMLNVSDVHIQDRKYFKQIQNELENGGPEALLHYLINYKIKIDIGEIPKTKELLNQMLMSESTEVKFWHLLLDESRNSINDQWNTHITKQSLYELYCDFCNQIGESRYKSTSSVFGKRIKKLCPSLGETKRKDGSQYKYWYAFPPLDQARKEFEIYTGYQVFEEASNNQDDSLTGHLIETDLRNQIDDILDEEGNNSLFNKFIN
jgi:phage/plasmid-associated DNA primase